MEETARITINGVTHDFPVITGTEDEKAIDISTLRAKSFHITLDNGFGNTGACASGITFLDGEKGVLRYRGIPIEELAGESTFIETAYLLIKGELPTQKQLDKFAASFTRHASLHKDMLHFFKGYPATGHPMGLLSAVVCSLSGYYPELLKTDPTEDEI